MPPVPYDTSYLQYTCDYCNAQVGQFCCALNRCACGNYWGLSGPTVPHMNRLRKCWDAQGIHKYPYTFPVEVTMADCSKFWMVFRMPTRIETNWMSAVKHASIESARDEALRLASANPGHKFYVAEFTGYAEVTQPATFVAF